MTRKLASIQKILDIQPIPDADSIEVATVLGWKCVIAKKDNFKVGDLVVYVEIDSIMPEKPEYEFLRSRKFRIRTIKLRGQVSQGLVLPVSVLPKKVKISEGDDVTDVLGVKKYDPQAEIEDRLAKEQANKLKRFLSRYSWFRRWFGKKRARFPSFISITDEDRIQLFPDICTEQAGVLFQVTEKLDGQSASYFLIRQKGLFKKDKFTFGVCSRRLLLNRPDTSSYWQIARKLNVEKALKNIIGDYDWVAIQGEIVGVSIQGNKYNRTDREFYAFNLIYPDGKVNNMIAKEILMGQNIDFVPVIFSGIPILNTIENMLALSNGTSALTVEALREGLVWRNYEKGISFKVVSPEFLLKYGE